MDTGRGEERMMTIEEMLDDIAIKSDCLFGSKKTQFMSREHELFRDNDDSLYAEMGFQL